LQFNKNKPIARDLFPLAQLLVAQIALEDDNLDPNNGQHNIHPFPGEQIELTFLRAEISTEKE
jgi:hypothetical protein